MMKSNNLPADSRVWIYACNRNFDQNESAEIEKDLSQFVNGWEAHGSKLQADAQLVEDKFLVFYVDENVKKATGCSIDSSVALVKSIEEKYQVDFFDRSQVNYLLDGKLTQCNLNDFWARRKALIVTEDTIVYDNLVKTKGEFENSWKVPFKESWHQEMWR